MKYIAFMLFLLTMATATANEITVTEIATLPQLPERGIQCVYRDTEGYLWYGTSNGVCRDDGYRINLLRPGKDNFILHIAEDSIGRLWVSTGKGAYLIDKSDYSITPIDEERLRSYRVNSVYFTADGTGWVNQHGVLRRYDREGRWMKDYPVRDRRGKATYVSGFCQTRAGDILMTSYSHGVYRYDSVSDSFRMYAPIDRDVSLGMIVQDVVHDYLWVHDHDATLYRLDPEAETMEKRYVASPIVPPGSKSGEGEHIYSLAQDRRYGYLWAVSRSHLLAFMPESDGRLTPLDLPVCRRFSGAMISSVYATSGALIVAAFDRPSAVLHLRDNIMSDRRLTALRARYNNSPVITAVVPDDNHGLMWMVQLRTGLVLYNLADDRLTYHDDDKSMKWMRLHMAEVIARSELHDGVWVSQQRSPTVHCVGHDDMRLVQADSVTLRTIVDPRTAITALFEDSRSRLWLGTTSGLFCYDIIKRLFVGRYNGVGYVSGIAESSDGSVWAATRDKGICKLPPPSGARLTTFPHNEKYSSIAIAPNDHVWLGTYDGRLLSFNPYSRTIADHTAEGNPKGNGITHVSVDKFGHVWVLTDQQLSEYNPRNSSRRNYAVTGDTGLYRYLAMAPSLTADGELCVGGVGGLSLLTPSNALDREESHESVRITDIVVGGRSRVFADTTGLYTPGHLTLKPDDRNIVIHFSSLNHRYTPKVRYAYRIKGLDPDWNYTAEGENTAFYNTLGRGRYTLEVRACDENNLWSPQAATLTITRLPAFYETWWAFALYALVVIGAGSWLLYMYLRRVKAKSEEMWADSEEMMKMRTYLSSPVRLPEEEFMHLDKVLVEKATRVVEDSIAVADFDVAALARGVNMSRSSLTRKLKAITGRAPLDFIRHIKMLHACRLLESCNHTVSEVGEMVGYADRRYFTASFKKEIGMTPTEYQKTTLSDRNLGVRFESQQG